MNWPSVSASLHIVRRIFVTGVLAFAAGSAFPQAASTDAEAAAKQTTEAGIGNAQLAQTAFARLNSKITDGATKLASGLAPTGTALVMILTAIVVVWSALKALVDSPDFGNIVTAVFFPMLFGGLALFALQDNRLATAISSSVMGLGTYLSSALGAETRSEGDVIVSALATAASLIWPGNWVGGESARSSATGFAWLWEKLGQVGAGLVAAALLPLYAAFATVLLVIASGIAVAVMIWAKFQVAIAVGLAPLFIPWILFRPTAFIFNGWLKFVLTSTFLVVIAQTVMALVVGTIQLTIGDVQKASGFESIGAMTSIAALSMVLLFAMLRADSLANGLFSGASEGISGAMASMTKGAVPAVGGGAISGMARGSNAAAAGVKGAAAGAQAGGGVGGAIRGAVSAARSSWSSAGGSRGSGAPRSVNRSGWSDAGSSAGVSRGGGEAPPASPPGRAR